MSLLESAVKARVYDLGQPLESATPVSPNHPPFRIGFIQRLGDRLREDGGSGAAELLSLGGHTGTHIDALCHISNAQGKIFGGIDGCAACQGGLYATHGVDKLEPIVCRGVFLDVPAALGVESLAPAQPITADDLERTRRMAKVEIRPGDAVLIRSGWPVGRYHDQQLFSGWKTGVPGPDASAARWLAERKIRVTGADTIAYEIIPPDKGHTNIPVHVILLVDNGIPIMEVLKLDELARDKVYEFLFVASPLRITGASGSPIRPLAFVEKQ